MYCQKCRTPLRLDSSLEDLNPAAYDLLVGKHNNLDGCNNIGKQDTAANPHSHALATGTKEAIRTPNIVLPRPIEKSDI